MREVKEILNNNINSIGGQGFSHEETQMIMTATTFEALDVELQKKLTELSLDRYFDVLSRNIMLLLKAQN